MRVHRRLPCQMAGASALCLAQSIDGRGRLLRTYWLGPADHVKLPMGRKGSRVSKTMSLTRRDFLAGVAAIGTAGFASEAHAYSTKFSKAAMAYFAGTEMDNGHVYRSTNWKKIKAKWRRQLVKYKSI